MSSELFVVVTFHRLACLKIFPLSQMTDPPGQWTSTFLELGLNCLTCLVFGPLLWAADVLMTPTEADLSGGGGGGGGLCCNMSCAAFVLLF